METNINNNNNNSNNNNDKESSNVTTATNIATNNSITTTKSKVNFGFTKKKKKEKTTKAKEFESGNNNNNKYNDDENEYTTIAEAAIHETKRRQEMGIELTIPLKQEEEENKKNEPLLFGFKRIINGESSKDNGASNADTNADTNVGTNTNTGTEKDDGENKEAEDALMQMAAENLDPNHQNKYDNSTTNFSSHGPSSLVIQQVQTKSTSASKSATKKEQEGQTPNTNNIDMDETIKYQRDLQHRAEDLDVHSQAYVKVPISEFGAAMLRGMGWKSTNNDNDNNNNNNNDSNNKDNKKNSLVGLTQRPHRLGLGATALPPSMKRNDNGKSNSGNYNNKRHRARKGGRMEDLAKVEKEEEEERIWKQKMEEKKENDVQITIQIGSIVYIRNDDDNDDNDNDNDNNNHNEHRTQTRKRAKMIKTAGVPGLNRVLIRYEGEETNESVKKGDVILVNKVELEKKPFDERQQNHKKNKKNYDDDHDDHDDHNDMKNDSRKGEERKKSNQSSSLNKERKGKDRYSRTSSSRSRSRDRSVDRNRDRRDRKTDHRDRRSRRDRSHSRERSRRRRQSRDAPSDDEKSYTKSRRDKDSDRDRHRDRDRNKDRNQEYKKSHRDSDEKRRDKRRRKDEEGTSRNQKKTKYEDEKISEHHWLTPNIRVRVVTKKVAKGRQYKQKGVVMDVLNRGTDAVVHMEDGELIERIPERYLETALPKVGGNVIILTGSNQFAKGKLLERNSSKGKGAIQLFEDMNVVTLSLDDIAEWCGSLDDECFD